MYKNCFQCDRCEKAFKQKSALDAHMLIHTGDRPYPCVDCPMRFRNYIHFNEPRCFIISVILKLTKKPIVMLLIYHQKEMFNF